MRQNSLFTNDVETTGYPCQKLFLYLVSYTKIKAIQVWCFMPVIPALGRERYEDHKFKAILGYIGDPVSKKSKSIWIKALKVKAIKLLGENRGVNFHDIGFVDGFL
jgi:hypothetical protein